MQGLGGLQSLIARGMRNPTQRAPIPPGLQALIQAQQALKQTAAPVTPGGIPTIAGQTEQAIQQQLQPAMPQTPQMGQPQAQVLGQGIPQAAQAAGIAAQQQQAQQQQALQQAMQMAQQQQAQPQPDQTQAQPMAEGGIAQLPADNMARIERYAHGGVLGFSGEKRSDVPDDDKNKEFMGGQPGYDEAGNPINPDTPTRRVEYDELGRPLEYATGVKEKSKKPFMGGQPGYDEAGNPIQPVAASPVAAAATPAAPTISPRPAGPVFKLPETPTISTADAIKQAETALGGRQGLSEYEQLLASIYKARQETPLQRQAELEQLGKGDVEIADTRRKAADETAFNRALAVLSGIGRGGIGGAGPEYLKFEQGQQAERARQIAEDQVRAATRSAIVDAQNAKRVNDMEAYAASLSKYQELVTHRQANVASLTNAILQSEATKESARTHAAATIASAQIHGLSTVEASNIHAAVTREGYSKPSESERLVTAYADVKRTKGEKAAEEFLQDRAKVQATLGGVKYEGPDKQAEREAKLSKLVQDRLKERAGLIDLRLQQANVPPKIQAQLVAQRAEIEKQVRKEIEAENPSMARSTGIASVATAGAPLYATNGKDRIMSTDGGKTWQPAR